MFVNKYIFQKSSNSQYDFDLGTNEDLGKWVDFLRKLDSFDSLTVISVSKGKMKT